ncbi:cytochrome P450 83B1-like [Herrania umbratica]|uniref:Cytochrome P450 83B1-like n=1 Tax=Herrania umbratica TaxID=108875 RepID=A0A6J1A9V5_9ROSI|nr:cytochrome P450 83B1-like [Herrania umbratica]
MTFLMKYPRCLKKAQDEVRSLIRKNDFVIEDDIQDLTYLKAVIKETFRLQPIAPLLLPRETIRKSNISGYEIPAKTLVYVNAWAIGRDPEAWENPEEFYPERFIGSSIDYKGLDFELIPFGAGRRVCPGIHMGVATVELALANLLYKFDWEMPIGMSEDDLDFDVTIGLSLHKKNALCLVANEINV